MHRFLAFMIVSTFLFVSIPVNAALFFSEYVEGGSNNKALEIFNDSSTIVDLSTFSVRLYNNGGSDPSSTIPFQERSNRMTCSSWLILPRMRRCFCWPMPHRAA